MALLFVLPLVSSMFGIWLTTKGMWELRLATDKKSYMKQMMIGLSLLLVVTPVFLAILVVALGSVV